MDFIRAAARRWRRPPHSASAAPENADPVSATLVDLLLLYILRSWYAERNG